MGPSSRLLVGPMPNRFSTGSPATAFSTKDFVRLGGALLLGVLVLQGCGTVRAVKSLFGGIFPVEVRISSDLNRTSPLALDIVITYDKKVLAKLREMPARDWFEKRTQILRDHEGALQAWPFEWVPGQEVEPLALRYEIGADRAVVFADYYSPGPHRLLVDPHRGVRLLLEADGFTVEPLR